MKKVVMAVLLCEAVGWAASIPTRSSVATWYQTLMKPSWTPPDSVFMPVWTFLYLLMGLALALVWNDDGVIGSRRGAYIAFWIQLFLNGLWSFLFFGLRSPLLALVDIAALVLAVFFTIGLFHRVSNKAALLLLPYFFWVCFACALNISIVKMNGLL